MTARKQLERVIADEKAIPTLVDFLIKTVNWPIPNAIVKLLLPWVLEKAIELAARTMPERIVREAFTYISDEVGDSGILSLADARAYGEFITDEVDIPWVPSFVERQIFTALVLLLSHAANSGLSAIGIANADESPNDKIGDIREELDEIEQQRKDDKAHSA